MMHQIMCRQATTFLVRYYLFWIARWMTNVLGHLFISIFASALGVRSYREDFPSFVIISCEPFVISSLLSTRYRVPKDLIARSSLQCMAICWIYCSYHPSEPSTLRDASSKNKVTIHCKIYHHLSWQSTRVQLFNIHQFRLAIVASVLRTDLY